MNGIKGYISIREASYRWGVSERRVNQYCAEGRIPGASRFGRSWAIPENAEKPSDPRTAIPAGQAPDESPPHWNWKHPQKGSERYDLRRELVPPISER
jgi:hypothetical protein